MKTIGFIGAYDKTDLIIYTIDYDGNQVEVCGQWINPKQVVEKLLGVDLPEDIVEKIVDEARKIEGITILDYSSDKDHNRTVLTMIGSPETIKKAAINTAKKAGELIDMTRHQGAHPRMGATDVIPFTPVTNVTIEECSQVAKEVGMEIGSWGVPVYLYEDAATTPVRKNLEKIRKGQYEGFFDKIKEEPWAAVWVPF